MTDRQLETLLRMAGEAHELFVVGVVPSEPAERPAQRIIRFAPARLSVGLAAAATLAAMVALPFSESPSSSPALARATVVPVALCYHPSEKELDRPQVDLFHPVCEAGCAIVAIFREWNADCQCLSWSVHRFENGSPVADLRPGQPGEIPLNVSDDPPVEQVLVLAVAKSRDSLVAGDRADALLACLNESHVSPGPERDVSTYTSAVERCLPEGVTILPQTFVVSSR